MGYWYKGKHNAVKADLSGYDFTQCNVASDTFHNNGITLNPLTWFNWSEKKEYCTPRRPFTCPDMGYV